MANGSSPMKARAHQMAWPSPSGTCWRTVTMDPGSTWVGRNCSSASALPRSRRVASSSYATSKCSTSAVLPRPVTMQNCSIPAARASSTAYWISGLSTTGSISLAVALVAGRKRVPRPATGRTALRNGLITVSSLVSRANIAGKRKCGVSDGRGSGTCGPDISRCRVCRHALPWFRCSSTSRAWLTRVASQSDPPLSGWAVRIRRWWAARMSASVAPGRRPRT